MTTLNPIQLFCDKQAFIKDNSPSMLFSFNLSLSTNMPGHLQVLMKSASLENSSHLQSTLQLKTRGKKTNTC